MTELYILLFYLLLVIMVVSIKCLVDFWYCKHFVLVNIKRHLDVTLSGGTQTLQLPGRVLPVVTCYRTGTRPRQDPTSG